MRGPNEESQAANQPLVGIVVSDPEPVEGVPLNNSQSPITIPDSDGPDIARFLEPEGRVTTVLFPKP